MGIISLLLISTLVGIILTHIFESILQTNKTLKQKYYERHKLFFGFHVHHSTFGLLCFVVSLVLFFTQRNTPGIIWVGLGLGIIIMHTLSDGRFVFIEKEKR